MVVKNRKIYKNSKYQTSTMKIFDRTHFIGPGQYDRTLQTMLGQTTTYCSKIAVGATDFASDLGQRLKTSLYDFAAEFSARASTYIGDRMEELADDFRMKTASRNAGNPPTYLDKIAAAQDIFPRNYRTKTGPKDITFK
jgi:hypothetical protein